MNAPAVEVLAFSLASGACLGLWFLLLEGLGVLLRAGKVLRFFLDVLFCLSGAAAVFLCAMGVDQGRLRLIQIVPQAAGCWAAVTLLRPWVIAASSKLSQFFTFLRNRGSGRGNSSSRLTFRRRITLRKNEKSPKKT